MADKRIIELANEKLVLADGDMTMVDSESGTYKYDLNRLAKKTITDATLSIEGKPADAKAVGDALASVDVDTVNNARQLLSDNYVLDEEPYLFRASGGEGADRVEECLVGGSVAWNQLIDPNFFDDSRSHQGVTFTRNSDGSITVNGTVTGYASAYMQISSNSNISQGHKYYVYSGSATGDVKIWYNGSGGIISTVCSIGTITTIANGFFLRINNEGKQVDETVKPVVIDLTTLFGSTIADYIYSLEQATAGAGVAWFKKYFPEDYYEYSAPTLKHVEGVSAKQIRDADDNVTAIYPLDSTLTLRGVPKLTDGKMWFDGDKYNADGTVERRYGIVDLGTLDWSKTTIGSSDVFTATLSNAKPVTSNTVVFNGIAESFVVISRATMNGTLNQNCIALNTLATLLAYSTTTYTDAATFKTAMSGVYLVYELATPTTETATPYTSLQTLDPHGTEEFVSTGIVPVGHESHYLENLRAKIEGLPKDFSTLIAPTEKEYKATQNYTIGSLLIVDNILYKVTSAIANGGTITPNTNCTATTLAAVIAAL